MAPSYSIILLGCDNDLCLEDHLDDSFESLLVNDEAGCLQALNDSSYQLVLADMTCPTVPVFELCQKIKDAFDIPVIFVSSVDNNEERLAAYDCGADDYLAIDDLKTELHGRLERVIINRIANVQLKMQLAQANEMAFIAMSGTSDLGVNIQFLLDVNRCNNLDELGMRVFQALKSYGISCSLQLRSQFAIKDMEANGMAKSLESKLLSEMKDQGRYVDFGHRSVMNYESVSLLVKNMPIDDEKKYGAIKDNVFSLLQGADARVQALDTLESLALEKNLVRSLTIKMKDLMSSVDESYQGVMKDIATVVEDMADNIESSMQYLGMDEAQEASLQATIEKAISSTNKIFNEGLSLDQDLHKFLVHIDALFKTEKINPTQLVKIIESLEKLA
ncbi:MAG: CheY-like chemotaxis protein [Oleispira sp.]|jgi:CheY-like chemotaxis protein